MHIKYCLNNLTPKSSTCDRNPHDRSKLDTTLHIFGVHIDRIYRGFITNWQKFFYWPNHKTNANTKRAVNNLTPKFLSP